MSWLSVANCKSYFESCKLSKLPTEVKSEEVHEVQCYDWNGEGKLADSYSRGSQGELRAMMVFWDCDGLRSVDALRGKFRGLYLDPSYAFWKRGREGDPRCLAVKFLGVWKDTHRVCTECEMRYVNTEVIFCRWLPLSLKNEKGLRPTAVCSMGHTDSRNSQDSLHYTGARTTWSSDWLLTR